MLLVFHQIYAYSHRVFSEMFFNKQETGLRVVSGQQSYWPWNSPMNAISAQSSLLIVQS